MFELQVKEMVRKMNVTEERAVALLRDRERIMAELRTLPRGTASRQVRNFLK